MKYSTAVSVVMSCYNQGRYVSEAITSILEQSFTDLELIIINDGSADNTAAEIKKFKDNRIRYMQLKTNKGNYPARNLGMKMARGKYICVMDADDIAHTNRLYRQVKYLELHKQVGCIGSQGEIISKNGIPLGKRLIKPTGSSSQLKVFLLMDNYVLHPSMMFRSNILRRYGLFYNERYRFSSDYDFVAHCSLLFPVLNIEDVLVKYRFHEEQISKKSKYEQMVFADQIRLAQVKRFRLRLSQEEKNAYLLLMKRTGLKDHNHVRKGMAVLNKILDRNNTMKLYDQRHLYALFDYAISAAREKLRIGDPASLG